MLEEGGEERTQHCSQNMQQAVHSTCQCRRESGNEQRIAITAVPAVPSNEGVMVHWQLTPSWSNRASHGGSDPSKNEVRLGLGVRPRYQTPGTHHRALSDPPHALPEKPARYRQAGAADSNVKMGTDKSPASACIVQVARHRDSDTLDQLAPVHRRTIVLVVLPPQRPRKHDQKTTATRTVPPPSPRQSMWPVTVSNLKIP